MNSLKLSTCLAAGVLSASLLLSGTDWPDLSNESLFPPQLLPGWAEMEPSRIAWHGLASLYPHRILASPPPPLPHVSGPPRFALLPGEVPYLRTGSLAEALDWWEQNPTLHPLILDLRFVESTATETLRLAGLLGLPAEALQRVTANDFSVPSPPAVTEPLPRVRRPLVVLFNHATAGPLEILCAQLPKMARIATLGRNTAGRTGEYRVLPESEGFLVLASEWRTAEQVSLLGSGARPLLRSPASREDDENGYLGWKQDDALPPPFGRTEGTAADTNNPAANAGASGNETTSSQEIKDLTLERAVVLVEMLRALGRLPGPITE